MWMMVVVVSMTLMGQPIQVTQIAIRGFANESDCLAKMATVKGPTTPVAADHTVTLACQPQIEP